MTEKVQATRQRRLKVAAQLRFVIYARKSGPGDRSVTDQETVGRRDIESIGGVVVAVFTDNLSASRYRRVQERPGFVETKDYIRAGRADALWTFANSRAHRTLDDYVELRSLCVETGALWRYGDRTFDLTKSADRHATASDALRSEGQSDDISEAVNSGVQSALKENKAHGKLLRGYRIIRDERTGRAITREPIPAQAKLIQRAAERVLAGESINLVMKDFIPAWEAVGGTGSIDRTALRAMLINPSYAGLRTYKGKVHGPGNWPPILSTETHDKLCKLLMDSSRRTQEGTAPVHWLSCIANCGSENCRKKVVGKIRREKKSVGKIRREFAPAYRCPDGHVSRGMQAVNDYVEEFLMRWLEHPEVLAKLTARDEHGRASIDADLAAIDQLQREIEDYVRDAAKKRLSSHAVTPYVEVLESEIREARARVDAMTVAVDPAVRDAMGADARQKWAGYIMEQKRNIVRATMTVTIMPVEHRGRYSDIGVKVRPLRMLA